MSHDAVTGRSKGFCFVEFADPQTAQAAMAMDGFDLAGRKIKVGRPSNITGTLPSPTGAGAGAAGLAMLGIGFPGSTPAPPPGLPPSMSPQEQAQILLSQALGRPAGTVAAPISAGLVTKSSIQNATPGLGGGVPPLVGASAPATSKSLRIKNIRAELTVDEISGILSSFGDVTSCLFVGDPAPGVLPGNPPDVERPLTRTAVVEFTDEATAKATLRGLTASGDGSGFDIGGLIIAVELEPPIRGAAGPQVQLCRVRLQHMISVEEARDPDLKEEVAEEANNYGHLLRVDIAVTGSVGVGAGEEAVVTLVYAEAKDAAKAHKAMHGRFFAGKAIKATLLP